MTAQKCLELLREVKDAAFATIGLDGAPRVRIIDVMLIEDGRLYFCTARGKDFYRELMRDPHVAVTALNRDYQTVRLTGKARQLEGQKKWIDRIFEENPSMNAVYPGDARYILEPFCIASGKLEFFDLSSEPINREYFAFGSERAEEKGFYITSSCIGCGTCQAACPQQCISEGAPFEIDSAHCLHCGLCCYNCPVGAIKRIGEQEQ